MCDCPDHKLETANAIAQGKEAGAREERERIIAMMRDAARDDPDPISCFLCGFAEDLEEPL